MSESGAPDPLEGLGRRIAERQRSSRPKASVSQGRPADGSAVGFALRIGTELVAALLVGLAIGWVLDRWLGTRPWLMIVFVFLGIGAGLTSVYRAVSDMGKKG